MWGWITVKFFSHRKKVKSSLGWEFSSGWDLCISLLEKSSHLVQEVIYSLHPNANISSGTEKEIGSRRRLPSTQNSSNPSAFLWMEWFLFSPLPATPGYRRERVSPIPNFQVFFWKGRERVSCPPWPQFNKFGRKLITDRFNGGVAEQTRKNIIQPYWQRWNICLSTIACFQQWPTTDILGIVQLLWYFTNIHPALTNQNIKLALSQRWHLQN